MGVDAPIELTLNATQSYLEWGQLDADHWWYAPNVYAYDDFVDLGNLPMYAYVVYTDRRREQIGFAPAVPCE